MEKVNLADKFARFSDHWKPRIAGALNGQYVKLAKLQGAFIWHQHADEDELFFVVKGQLTMEFRDHSVEIGPNEFIIVPRGVEHRPVAEEEVHLLLFEPQSTLNTGETRGARTVENLEWI